MAEDEPQYTEIGLSEKVMQIILHITDIYQHFNR